MAWPTIVVVELTGLIGTGDEVQDLVGHDLAQRGRDFALDVVSNPEFLRERAAIADFMRPDRLVVGSESPSPIELLRELYARSTGTTTG